MKTQLVCAFDFKSPAGKHKQVGRQKVGIQPRWLLFIVPLAIFLKTSFIILEVIKPVQLVTGLMLSTV